MFSITVLLTVGVNALIDYFMYRSKPPSEWAISGPATVVDFMLFAFILSVLIFFGSVGVHDRIKAGKAAAIDPDAFRATCAQRFFLFALAEPNWKKRLPLFLWQALLIPTILIYIIVVLSCWASVHFRPMAQYECRVSLGVFLLYRGVVHGVLAAFLYAQNYASAHNAAQKEIRPPDDELEGFVAE